MGVQEGAVIMALRTIGTVASVLVLILGVAACGEDETPACCTWLNQNIEGEIAESG